MTGSIRSKALSFFVMSAMFIAFSARSDDSIAKFDPVNGTLAVQSSAQGIDCRITADGFVTLTGAGIEASSDPRSPHFATDLNGATRTSVRCIISKTELVVSAWNQSGPLRIEAKQITLKGKARLNASALTLAGRERIVIEAGAEVTAKEGANGGVIVLSAPFVLAGGKLDVSGDTAGKIEINATNIFSHGQYLADGARNGGLISIHFSDIYTETAEARTSARGTAGSGGRVEVDGGDAGNYFSSGAYDLDGATGGSMHLNAHSVKLYAATIDAGGEQAGGSVLIGGDGRSQDGAQIAKTVDLNHATRISTDANTRGNGGRIVVWSREMTDVTAHLSARGGSQSGDGGFIEVSGKDKYAFNGVGDAAAPHGQRGTLLIDPKNNIIRNDGVLPQFEFVNPDAAQAANDRFGGNRDNDYDYPGVVPLNNGNILILNVADHTNGTNSGAIRLYNGDTGALICSYIGNAGDKLGQALDNNSQPANSPAYIVGNGNAVIISQNWSSNKGAATWINKAGFVSGQVSSSNSIVGAGANDFSSFNVTVLKDTNYILTAAGGGGSATWVNGNTGVGLQADGTIGTALSTTGMGANNSVFVFPTGNKWLLYGGGGVRFCTTGVAGAINNTNSLIGGGFKTIKLLGNGNYLVTTSSYVTWCNGSTGLIGDVSASNSLTGVVGSSGSGGVVLLANNNYVVVTPDFSSGRGAVTFGNGASGVVGSPTSSNSVLGVLANTSQFPGDNVGSGGGFGGGVVAMRNGNYVIVSPSWNQVRGAVTWVNGTNGLTIDSSSTISATNSLVGTTPNFAFNSPSFAGDSVGGSPFGGSTTIEIGTIAQGSNYVVASTNWGSGKGAITKCNGTTGLPVGQISLSNSLTGVTTDSSPGAFDGDRVGEAIYPLAVSGNYVATSIRFNNKRGAVTWGSFSGTLTGTLNSTNSLVGASSQDFIGSAVKELTNGNFVTYTSTFNNNRGSGA